MLYSMFAMIILTGIVSVRLLFLRVVAVKKGKVNIGQFRLNNSTDIPNEIAQAAKNYANLFEMPVLFYAVGILALTLQLQNTPMVILSWVFVASRVLHSWIHLTYNNVIHRLQAFLLGVFSVFALWILLVWEYAVR
jgi:hypothetical protein